MLSAQGLVGACLQYPTLCLLLLALLLLVTSYYVIRPRNLPPGPWGLPWVGSPHLFGDDMHKDFNKMAQKYGPIFSLMMGTRPMIIINSNELIREAFIKRADVFSNRPIMYNLDYMDFFDELFNVHYSEVWKENKKVMTRIHRAAGFGSSSIEPYFMKVLDLMFVEMDKFEEKAFFPKDTLHDMMCITLCKIVFNAEFKYGDDEMNEVRALAVAWVDSTLRSGMNMGYWADNVPSYITKRLMPKMMGFMKKSSNDFQKFIVNKIEQHRATYDGNHVRDVIDGYLMERGDDETLTDDIMACTMLMMFPDGIDSAGIFLEFVTLYLAYYPEWQRKIQDQIDEVCGDRRPGLADRPDLPLVEATMYEVGRVANVVCLSIAHSAQHDTTFHGYNIPEDCYILANFWAAHMEKDLFPQGDRFAPETLIDGQGKLKRNPKIMVFGIGRRNCIGELLVKNETFLYISNALQRYDFRFPEGEPLPSLETEGGLIRQPIEYKVRALRRHRK